MCMCVHVCMCVYVFSVVCVCSNTHKYVLWFDVSVHYLVGMEIDQCHAKLSHSSCCVHLTEVLAVQNGIKQVTPLHTIRIASTYSSVHIPQAKCFAQDMWL